MRRLILLRHGKTVAAVPAGDHARHLSPRGIVDAAEAGRRLALIAMPDVAIVSDARRTRETFDRIVESIGHEIAHRFEARLYGASAEGILALLQDCDKQAGTVLIIGHNPGIGDLARQLCPRLPSPERRELDAHFPTSAFAILGFAAADWSGIAAGGTLEAFVQPKTE